MLEPHALLRKSEMVTFYLATFILGLGGEKTANIDALESASGLKTKLEKAPRGGHSRGSAI